MSKRLITIGIVFLFLLTANVILQINHNRAKKKNIQEEIALVNEKIANLKEQIKRYDERIASLSNDFEKEKLARNMIKMAKPDEVIYKFVDKDKDKDKKETNTENNQTDKSKKMEEKK